MYVHYFSHTYHSNVKSFVLNIKTCVRVWKIVFKRVHSYVYTYGRASNKKCHA